MNNFKLIKSTLKQNHFWQFIIAEMIVAVILRIIIFRLYNELFINDTYIFLRYAENLAHGNGLVYNIGEKILGYSSPFYVILLAGLRFISMNLSFSLGILVLNLLLFIVSAVLCALLIKNRGVFGLIFFTVFCFYFSYVDASVNGMETMLMLTIILLALNAYRKENMELAYILGTISLIIRPEGSLFIASIFIASVFLKKRMPSLTSIIICVLLLLIWLIPTYLYFGNILPDSMLAKSSLFTGNQWSGIKSGIIEKDIMLMLGLSDKVYFSFGFPMKMFLWLVSAGITILIVIGFFRALHDSPVIVVAVIFFILSLFFYSFGSPVRMFSWYTIVPSIISMFVAFSGADYLLHQKKSIWMERFSIVIILLFCLLSLINGMPHRSTGIMRETDKNKKLIRYLESTASGIKSIMISDIGYVGYWTPWRIIDGSGLVSPQILIHRENEKLTYLSDIFNREKPDVIFFKVDILHSNIINENMRYGTFRTNNERDNFLNNYTEVSKAKDFAEIFIRKSLLSNPDPIMLK